MESDEPNPEEISQSTEKLKHQVLKPGESFGNFRVVKCLCAGLTANYYHMQHNRDLHDVTVGIFHHRTQKDSRVLTRLQNLQKAIRGIDHEGIPKIRDCTEIDGNICIFLDPIKGQTLSQYFKTHADPGSKGLDQESTTRITAQLLGILGYAHTQGLDHRDIDSDMVFIQGDGSISLLGLGIKAALGTDLFEEIVSASVSPLESNKTLGRLNSFDVMSPEYKAGVAEDPRVDLFCIGVISYWLLTSRKPQEAKLELPTTLVEGLPSRWDRFMERILSRERDERFQSCKLALLSLKETDDEIESESSGFVQRQIDRLPVPKRIIDRGDLAIRLYRLSLIGFVGLTLTALAAFFLSVSFMDEEVYTKGVAKLAAAGQTPQLVIKVQPPVSKIEFPEFDQSFISNDGLLKLRIVPGNYKIRASSPYHKEESQMVQVGIEEQPSTLTISFELEATWEDIKIQSEPGAIVSVVDAPDAEIELGLTDEEGNFLLEKVQFAGASQVMIKKEGYAPTIIKNQELKFGEVSTIEAPLIQLPARFLVRTNPPGARILINDIDIGLSPVSVVDINPSDQCLVVAQLEKYRSVDRRLKLAPGDDLVVDLGKFVPKSAELRLSAEFEGRSEAESKSLLKETEVRLGERSYPFGSLEWKVVPEGDYTIELRHPLYTSKPIDLTLADRDVKTLSFKLSPRPGQVELILPGKLDVSVLLNRKEIKMEGPTVSIPAYQDVEFELRIRNYLTMVKNFELKPNEKVAWEVQPVPIPGPVEGKAWAMPYLGLKLAWIPPGEFTMGSPVEEQGRLPNEGDQTEVAFTKGFWVGVHEVTQAEFRQIVDKTPSNFVGDKRPVDSVTWKDADAFCRLLTEFERDVERLPEGYIYRLPSEAEWEYAARAGTTTPFNFGKEADTSKGNFRGVYPRELDDGQRVTETYGTESVGSYKPNAFGLHDIHGNVSEWTVEAYNARLPGGRLIDPAPEVGGKRFTLRGGSWEDFAVRVRSAARSDVRMETESNAIGFRVFLVPEK